MSAVTLSLSCRVAFDFRSIVAVLISDIIRTATAAACAMCPRVSDQAYRRQMGFYRHLASVCTDHGQHPPLNDVHRATMVTVRPRGIDGICVKKDHTVNGYIIEDVPLCWTLAQIC